MHSRAEKHGLDKSGREVDRKDGVRLSKPVKVAFPRDITHENVWEVEV
jgi:hypothetical protein